MMCPLCVRESTDKPKNKKNFIDDNDVSIYKTKRTISTSLFTASTRPQHIQLLYEKAAPTPVVLVCNGDTTSEDNFSVGPLVRIGQTRRQITKKIDAEIETRVVSTFLCIFYQMTQMNIRSIRTKYNGRMCNYCQRIAENFLKLFSSK